MPNNAGTAKRIVAFCMPMLILACGHSTAADTRVQWKPDRAVEWLVPASAGSQLDAIVRMAQLVLQQHRIVDVPIVPINKGGAGQSIATTLLLNRSPADNPALEIMSATLLSAHILGSHNVDFMAATPLACLGAEYYVFAVKANSPIKSGIDLIARLKEDPRSVTLGISNLGGVGHIQMLAVLRAAGIDTGKLVVVGFKGGSQVRAALMGGDIELTSTSGSNMSADLQSGRIRVIAANAPQRLPGIYASVPTWKELGVDAAVLSGWACVLGPKGMTPAQVAFWDGAFSQMVKTPEWTTDAQRRLRSLEYRDSRQTREFLAAEYRTLQSIIKEIGISVN